MESLQARALERGNLNCIKGVITEVILRLDKKTVDFIIKEEYKNIKIRKTLLYQQISVLDFNLYKGKTCFFQLCDSKLNPGIVDFIILE